MAMDIELGDIGDYAKDQYEKLLRITVLEADKRLKEASPTDSGRLKASWQIGQNTESGGNKPEGKYPNLTLPPDRLNYERETVGNVYSVHNNVPYAEPVLMGDNLPRSWQGRWRSKGNQIQKGYPLVIAQDLKNFVRTNAARIGRSS